MSFLNVLQSNVANKNSSFQNNYGQITLSCGGESFPLPILPEEFEVQVATNNQTVNINSFGDLLMVGKTGLKTIKISAFFPAQRYSFCVATPETPYYYVNMLEKWRVSGQPVKIIVSDTNIALSCLIDNFTYSERDGSHDVYYSIDLHEYRDIKTLDSREINSTTGLNQRPVPSIPIREVQSFNTSDNLLSDCRKVIGKSANAGINQQETYLEAYARLVKQGFNADKITAIGGRIDGI